MTAMDPINPWIDPAETRRMAERLMLPAREPVATPEEAGFGDSFVGFSGLPADAADEATPAAGDIAPGGAVDPELSRHWDWLRGRFSASGCFVFDADGRLAFDVGDQGAFHFIARDFLRVGAPQSIRMRIRSNAVLELISIETKSGYLCLCLVVPEPLSGDAVAEIRHHWLEDRGH